ncbi:hypothetical protein MRX96_013322 [Rhipicephalus microplus]
MAVEHCPQPDLNLYDCQTSHHEMSYSGSKERSVAASQHYPKSPTSWKTIKYASNASVLAFTDTERSGSEAIMDPPSRVIIYGCPWWNDVASKDASGSTAQEAVTTCPLIPTCMLLPKR